MYELQVKRVLPCKECKKMFYRTNDYAYKVKIGDSRIIWFCSWTCLRKYEKKHPNVNKMSNYRGLYE